jgi:site-specific DNA-methyltransferase (adenine-specific)
MINAPATIDSRALIHLGAACRALSEAKMVPEVKIIRDKAGAIQQYLKQQGYCLSAQNDAAELKLRAERKLGELLASNGERRGGNSHGGSSAPLPDGIDWNQSHRWQRIASLPEQLFETHIEETKKAGDELTTASVIRVAKDYCRDQSRQDRDQLAALIEGDCGILHGDYREIGSAVPDNSVDLIFTDPPYDAETVPQYADLAKFAARTLIDGGSLITYFGQHALRQVMELMDQHLKYWWLNAIVHTGGNQPLNGKGVFVCWKPLLWYVKGTRATKDIVRDCISSEPGDKDLHDWAQGEKEARYYIEHLSRKSSFVVDPYCGSGTTLFAAKELGRRWTGFELDEAHVNAARIRLN